MRRCLHSFPHVDVAVGVTSFLEVPTWAALAHVCSAAPLVKLIPALVPAAPRRPEAAAAASKGTQRKGAGSKGKDLA